VRAVAQYAEEWRFGTHRRAVRGAPRMLWVQLAQNAGALRYSTPRLQGAAAGYQVTAGRTLIVTRLVARYDNSGHVVSMGYSDSDRGMSNAADGANPITLDGLTADALGVLIHGTPNVLQDWSVYYEVPATKYPRIAAPAGAGLFYALLFGVEV
jgi:hypothetical protein